jgi:ribosomal protein S27E
MHDTQNPNIRPLVGRCPVCFDMNVVFDSVGTGQMVQCGACGSIVPLAEVQAA